MMLVMMLIKPSCFLTAWGETSQPKTYKIYTKNISHYYIQGGRRVPRHTPYSYPIKKTAPGIFFNCPGLQSGQSGLCTCHFDTITRGCDRIGVDCCCYGSRGFFDVFQSIWGIFILVQQKMTQNTTETLCLFLKNDRQFHCVGWSITNFYIYI